MIMKVPVRDCSKYTGNLKLLRLQSPGEKRYSNVTVLVPPVTTLTSPTHSKRNPWRNAWKLGNHHSNSYGSKLRQNRKESRDKNGSDKYICTCPNNSLPKDDYLCK